MSGFKPVSSRLADASARIPRFRWSSDGVGHARLGATGAGLRQHATHHRCPAWPRRYTIGDSHFALYRPQLESWSGNALSARAVMTMKTGVIKDEAGKPVDVEAYGVVWLSARAETDRAARDSAMAASAIERFYSRGCIHGPDNGEDGQGPGGVVPAGGLFGGSVIPPAD
jgi:hypothetical protein